MKTINIMLDLLKTAVLQAELAAIEKYYVENKLESYNMISEFCHVTQEIYNLPDMDALKEHLMKGSGLKKREIERYMSDLFFSTTCQVN